LAAKLWSSLAEDEKEPYEMLHQKDIERHEY